MGRKEKGREGGGRRRNQQEDASSVTRNTVRVKDVFAPTGADVMLFAGTWQSEPTPTRHVLVRRGRVEFVWPTQETGEIVRRRIHGPTFPSSPCSHRVRNRNLLLSRLPVVCPVGRPMVGYRAPAAPTRYFSTAVQITLPQRPQVEVEVQAHKRKRKRERTRKGE